jgi:hypothetical protein
MVDKLLVLKIMKGFGVGLMIFALNTALFIYLLDVQAAGQFNSGQIYAVTRIADTENIVLNLSSSEDMARLRDMFPQKLNYTGLLFWESERLNYTENRTWHSDPIEILNHGKGACGEFSILYVAICLANDIPGRYVTTGYFIPNTVDHAWAEVNPSQDGKSWIHVEVTDACVSIQTMHELNPSTINNTMYYVYSHFKMVLAFQITEDRHVMIIDRTSVYSPNQ